MKKWIIIGCATVALLFTVVKTHALVEIDPQRGDWPADWPKALESLRAHAQTAHVGNGTQEEIYAITFANREEFEKAWPQILSLKTPGAPLRLYKVGGARPAALGGLGSTTAPVVRIYAPVNSEVSEPNGQRLKTTGPWPKELSGPNGELPEYVQQSSDGGEFHWVACDPKNAANPVFHFRARTDIDLIVDGAIIDLNRIKLPQNTPLEDHRF